MARVRLTDWRCGAENISRRVFHAPQFARNLRDIVSDVITSRVVLVFHLQTNCSGYYLAHFKQGIRSGAVPW